MTIANMVGLNHQGLVTKQTGSVPPKKSVLPLLLLPLKV